MQAKLARLSRGLRKGSVQIVEIGKSEPLGCRGGKHPVLQHLHPHGHFRDGVSAIVVHLRRPFRITDSEVPHRTRPVNSESLIRKFTAVEGSRAFPLPHADAGPMHLYLNYAREHWTHAGERPPVGLTLCSEQDHAVARYALAGLDTKVLSAECLFATPDMAPLALCQRGPAGAPFARLNPVRGDLFIVPRPAPAQAPA